MYATHPLTRAPPLAYVAGHTRRIKLGTSIAHIDGRTAAMTAMTAQTIDAMAGGGRFLLGIGISGPQVVEGWHGRLWGKPNYRLRGTVAVIRKIWSGDKVQDEGREIRIPYPGETSRPRFRRRRKVSRSTPAGSAPGR